MRQGLFNQIGRTKRKAGLLFSTVVCVVLLLVAGFICLMGSQQVTVNLLAPKDWTHFPGAEIADEGIHIKSLGRQINHRDTSTAQPNPPVNYQGPHLKVAGDFQIEAVISGIDNGAVLQMYGQVPVIYDEWRQERESVRIEATSEGIRIRIWDGTAASSIDERTYKTLLKDTVKITVVHRADKLFTYADNKLLGSLPDHDIFAGGTVWFGADANRGTEGWTLRSLQAQSLEKQRLELVPPPDLTIAHEQTDTLRGLALTHPRRLPIGAAIAAYPLYTDAAYRNIALGQFSMMTPENSMKPQFIHPQKDLYTYQDADSLVEAAIKNHMLVHGHALVMGKANPEWMQLTPKTERKHVMVDHITNVVSHFKGRVATWDVVNEPLSEDDIDYTPERKGLRGQMWFDVMGEDYIDTAFRAARRADPAAKLYLNDFGLENDGPRWDALVSLVKRLQARGVPIDGVGFESHVYHQPADTIDPAVLKQHIQALAELGIASRISEIDVLGDNPAVQSQQYANILGVCLSEPTCTSYTTWGVTDLYGSTTLADRYPVKHGDSLLWGVDYTPKPAVKSLQNMLKQQ